MQAIVWAVLVAAIPPTSVATAPLGDPLVTTVVVSPVLGDPVASGAALLAAYANASPGGGFPVLLKLEPGTYDIGSVSFDINKADVNFEGSGRDATRITGSGRLVFQTSTDVTFSRLSIVNPAGSGLLSAFGKTDLEDVRITAMVNGPAAFAFGVLYAQNAFGSVRDATIEATSPQGSAQAIALYSQTPQPTTLNRVSATAVGGSQASGVVLNSSVTLTDVTVDSSDVGFQIIASGNVNPVITITNCRVSGSTQHGIQTGSDGASTTTIQGSSIKGAIRSVDLFTDFSQAFVKIFGSVLIGPTSSIPPNRLRCAGTYDGMFRLLDGTCRPPGS